MAKKATVLALVALGLATFFLPLVLIRAPMVGTQKLSGWDAVKRSQQKRPQPRADLGLGDTLEKIQGDFLRRAERRDPPLGVKQAYALVVTLPLAYLTLVLGAVFAVLRRERALQVTAAVGLLAGVYSVLSVYWLSDAVKQMVAGGKGDPLFGMLRKKVAAGVVVSPELGLYLLAASLAALLLASFLPSKKR